MKNKIYVVLLITLICSQSGAQKPNLIYILTDQWRSTAVGYDGNSIVKTPNLDQFSDEAVIFKNAVSVCPLCTPYRAALMTGRFPTTTGMFMNDLYLPEKELCIAEIFKSAGYKTAYYGKWHLDGHGRYNNVQPYRRQGFDHWKALECSHVYNNMPYYENEDFELKYWDKYSPFAIVEDAGKYLEEVTKDEIPFLIRYPGIGENEGKEVFSPLHTPDILPTMLSLADIKIPDCIEGEDLSSTIGNPEKQKDRAVLIMSVYPITRTPITEYRGIRTMQYTYVKTPEKATMLFDNIADPYQLNNLVGKSESRKLQDKMDRILREKLKAIGDENFKPKTYYSEKWGYDFSEGRSIPYNVTPGKITRVYTPKN